jgi:hypothetical protein
MKRSAFLLLVLFSCVSLAAAAEGQKLKFKRTQIDSAFRSEGVSVGDFNGDGKLDISAGPVYFAAPDWKLVPVSDDPKTYDPHNYSNSFQNFADDVNGDDRTDLIVVDFPGLQTWWFEQPAEPTGKWTKHTLTPVTNNESPDMRDIDGDGRRELVFSYDPGKHVGFAKRAAQGEWPLTSVSGPNAPATDRFSHGIGAGDINGDGRQDIMVVEGWWEAPAEKSDSPWVFHPVKFGEPCAQMYAYDFDGDGDNDVLSSSAHGQGIWWHEQTPEGFKTHEISNIVTQTHSLNLVDMNGDGLKDFVTGKRYWAHGPKGDVRPDDPAVVLWFELQREGGKPVWTAHEIDHDSGVGTQFEVADVNQDGLLDVVTSNKKGTYYFEQVRE